MVVEEKNDTANGSRTVLVLHRYCEQVYRVFRTIQRETHGLTEAEYAPGHRCPTSPSRANTDAKRKRAVML